MSTQPRLKDKDIREPLFDFLEEQFGRVRIIEEKMMGRSRADVIMVAEDALIGIEIKSDADTYARLARQVKDYDLYYDYNYVVVGSSHGLHIEEHVPSHWGIITVERISAQSDPGETAEAHAPADRLDFYMLRHASRNDQVDMERKMQILWRPELAHIQQLNMMPKHANKSKRAVVKEIIDAVPGERLNRQISAELFERDYTTIEETLKTYRSENRRSRPRRRRRRKHPVQ